MSEPKKGLELMREPFPAHQISKLPKPTKQQTEAVRANFKVGIRCLLCNAWHHPDVVHLDYVGHAALTDRLLDADPAWNWEPLAMVDGLPLMDKMGGMWIKLTVCGVTRLGYGHAGDKIGGDAIKEVIGDCLRNSAMRFGAALDLWHKGDLHVEDDTKLTKSRAGVIKSTDGAADSIQDERRFEIDEIALHLIDCHNNGKDIDAFRIWYEGATFKENEERAYCWSLLPSKLRSAIKANKPAVLQAMSQLPEKR